MALTIGRGKTEPLLVDADTAATHVTVGDVAAGQVEQQMMTVNPTGEIAFVPTFVYTNTNFYIRQSRQYIPSKKLRVFINFRCFHAIMSFVVAFQLCSLLLISCLLGILGPTF